MSQTIPFYDIPKLKALDQDEWARLQKDYTSRVYYYVKRQLRDADSAEDVVSETFLGALRGIERYDDQYNIEQFLFGIARKKVIDHMRRGGHEYNITEDEDQSSFFGNVPGRTESPADIAVAREKVERQKGALVEILREWVGELWDQRDFKRLKAIELIFLTNWKHKRISDYLGYLDEKAVAGVKFRAIRDFQERLRLRDPNRSLFSKLWE